MFPSQVGGLLDHVRILNTTRDRIEIPVSPLPGDSISYQYEKLTLTPHKLCVKSEVLDERLRQLYYTPVQKFREFIDRSIIYGDGVNKPLGIVNTTATKCLEGDYKLSYDLMVEAIHNQPQMGWDSSTWLVHPNTVKKLVNTPAFQAIGTEALFGHPVITTTAVDEDDVILADLRHYIVGIRGGIERADWAEMGYDHYMCQHSIKIDGRPIVREPIDGRYPFVLIRFQYNETGVEKTILICKYCGTAWPEGIKCWDGVCGCGASILPAQGNRVCVYCGRIWPPGYDVCWDGVDGCGGNLGTQ